MALHHSTALHKTSRCRYFTDDGKPLRPFCYRDAACHYIHPFEEKWASAKNDCRSSFRYLGSKSRSPAGRMRSFSIEDNTRRYGRRASPLGTQSELFVRNARDYAPDDDRETPAGKNVEHYRRPSSVMDSLASSAIGTTSAGSAGKASESTAPQCMDFSSNSGRRSAERIDIVGISNHRPIPTGAPTAPREQDSSRQLAGSFAAFFPRLAHLSNKAAQSTAELEMEEKKLETYSELSDTLANVSSSAADTVASSLASYKATHAACKEQVQGDLASVEGVWQEIFDAFSERISVAVNVELQSALAKLTKEGEKTVKTLLDTGSTIKRKIEIAETEIREDRRKRRLMSDTVESSSRYSSDRENRDPRIRKRARQSSVSENADIDGSLGNILNDMKTAMSLQNQALEAFAKESSRLKPSPASIPQPFSTPSRPSMGTRCDSAHFTAQHRGHDKRNGAAHGDAFTAKNEYEIPGLNPGTPSHSVRS